MVAKITTPHRIKDALNYNESKVQKGQAECLLAANYLQDAKTLNFYQKLAGFESLNVLNDRAITKTIHVSLNFDPREKLSKELLSTIAADYMGRIGFGKQPYLVYQHLDAGHPHIHIVSTTIQEDGKRISTHNIGRDRSEKARKEIEPRYNLMKAQSQKQDFSQIKAVDVSKALYGKSETKRSIANVVNTVVNQYKFTSLHELNAVLKQFNVMADRGAEEGRIHKNRGLVYRILGENGNKIGVPIKASSLSSKPTLNTLEKKFTANEMMREVFKRQTKDIVEAVLKGNPQHFKDFMGELQKKQVYTVLRQNKEGLIYGITFVDNRSRCVFNGSDLGKTYSAASLQSRMANNGGGSNKNIAGQKISDSRNFNSSSRNSLNVEENEQKSKEKDLHNESLLEKLITPKEDKMFVPFQLLQKKRHKKNRNLRL